MTFLADEGVDRQIVERLRRLRLARQDHENRYGKSKGELSGKIVRSSGNVFADLGFADAGERQTKVRLAIAINGAVKRRGLSQAKAAELLGINQPKVSALAQYRLEGFSVERLMRFLTLLNQDVEIIIRNRLWTRPPGRVFVTAA